MQSVILSVLGGIADTIALDTPENRQRVAERWAAESRGDKTPDAILRDLDERGYHYADEAGEYELCIRDVHELWPLDAAGR